MLTNEVFIGAINAHSAWRHRLHDAIEKGTSEFSPEKISVDNQCEFGKWLYDVPADEQSDDYQKVKELHATFHKVASDVLSTALKGDKDTALGAMEIGGDYNSASSKLVLALSEWKKHVLGG